MAKTNDTQASDDVLMGIFLDTIIAMVRERSQDLTARQLGVLLKAYTISNSTLTVRGLAADLNISKPAVTRALDRLVELECARRKVDPLDRRSILIERTSKGRSYFNTIKKNLRHAAKAAGVQLDGGNVDFASMRGEIDERN